MTGTSTRSAVLAKSDSRRAARARTSFPVTISFQGREVPGRLHDLSLSGMQVVFERFLCPAPGSPIVVKCSQIGVIEGTVRWCRADRAGIQFSENSASVAQVKAYFRFFHRT